MTASSASSGGPGDVLDRLLAELRACTRCEGLPLGPRPVVRGRASARLRVVGQAPGIRVHETGVPWNDASGRRLRGWLGLDAETFYDESRVAITPVGFCYPGTMERGGDFPPRRECAPLWQPRLDAALGNVELVLLVGAHAQAWFLGPRRGRTMTETVRAWRSHLPRRLPLPHPSWRTTAWQRNNPWFDDELLPELRRRVARAVGAAS